jgi:hypothetical protein
VKYPKYSHFSELIQRFTEDRRIYLMETQCSFTGFAILALDGTLRRNTEGEKVPFQALQPCWPTRCVIIITTIRLRQTWVPTPITGLP